MVRVVILFAYVFLATLVSGREVKSSSEILKIWSADQHLYTKGDLPLSDASLNQLEGWLDDNAKNWTIVLMRNARGESWTNPQGRRYSGTEAAENVLGRGLGNNPSFSALVHPDSKQRNGAVFVLFLEERKFSYFGSDAYDKYRLGDSSWRGNLDAPAIRAMRGGGRIIDAVKDTVTSIDRKLSSAIEREERDATQRAQAKEYAMTATYARIDRTRVNIDQLKKEIEPLQKNLKTGSGDLANPDFTYWQSSLVSAKAGLDQGNSKYAQRLSNTIHNDVKRRREEVQNWFTDERSLAEFAQVLSEVTVVANDTLATQFLEESLAQFATAQLTYRAGNSAYVDHFRAAEASHRSLKEKNARTEHDLIIQEKQRVEQARLKKKMRIALIVCVSGALIFLTIYTNRRRRGMKAQAEGKLVEWRSAILERVDRLFKALDRATLVIGAESDLLEQKVSGRTREESIKAIRGVDYVFILSANVERVLKSAESLVYPSNIFHRTLNLFSRRRYDDALDLLERTEIQCHPSARKVLDRSDKDLLGSTEAAQQFAFTFPNLIKHYDKTLGASEVRIELVHQAWSTISDRTRSLGDLLSQVESMENAVTGYAIRDQWMECDMLYSVWLHAARELHQRALDLSAVDPLTAIEQALKSADAMAIEMLEVLGFIFEFRRDALPQIVEQKRQMQRQRRRSQWIDQSLEKLSDSLTQISAQGATASVANSIEIWKTEVQGQLERFELCVRVLTQLGDDYQKQKSLLENVIVKARRELGSKLGLPSLSILCESTDRNPSTRADRAESHSEQALDCIDQGEIHVADSLKMQVFEELELATSLVEQTQVAQADFAQRSNSCHGLIERSSQELVELKSELDALHARYSAHALRQEENSVESESMLLLAQEAQQILDQSIKLLAAAEVEFPQAQILQSRDLLIEVEQGAEMHHSIHKAVLERRDVLRGLEETNEQSLAKLQVSLESQARDADAHSSRVSTMQDFEALRGLLAGADSLIQSDIRSPFEVSDALEQIESGIESLENEIIADSKAHSSTLELLRNTENLLESTEGLVHRSRTDQIPDSQLTKDCVEKVSEHRLEQNRISSDLSQPHGEWLDMAQLLHTLSEKIILTHQTLVGDLKKADYAMHSILAGRNEVRRVLSWSGRFGVTASGSEAQSYLRAAEHSLFKGDYQAATNSAGASSRAAVHAISIAESAVATIKRRRDRERRSRNNSSSFGISSGSSSFGSGSSFGGGSSSGSSFSSGSGFGSSGW